MPVMDARDAVFCSLQFENVFDGVVNAAQVWQDDPTDVQEVHAPARAEFERVLDGAKDRNSRGRILALLGDSGCGKTHLMRAFRKQVHGPDRHGCFAYLQATVDCPDAMRFLRSGVISSLSQPYRGTGSPKASQRLSEAVAYHPLISPEDRETLRAEGVDPDDLGELIVDISDRFEGPQGLPGVDPNLLRALLYHYRAEAGQMNRVERWLKGDAMSRLELRRLPALAPEADGQHREALMGLGELIWQFFGGPLVIGIDQIDQIGRGRHPEDDFRRLIAAVCELSDHMDHSVFILALHSDEYHAYRPGISQSHLDRIETHPELVPIKGFREVDEVRAALQKRLSHLFTTEGISVDEDNPLYPLTDQVVASLAGKPIREVLRRVHAYRRACAQAERLLDWSPFQSPPTLRLVGNAQYESTQPPASQGADTHQQDPAKPEPTHAPASTNGQDSRPESETTDEPEEHLDDRIDQLAAAWQQHRSDERHHVPEKERDLANLLRRAVAEAKIELPAGNRLHAELLAEDTSTMPVLLSRHDEDVSGKPNAAEHRLVIGVCNISPAGGHLANRLKKLLKLAQKHKATPAAVRSGGFHFSPQAKATQQVKSFQKQGGLAVEFTELDWRSLVAIGDFWQRRAGGFDQETWSAWRTRQRPLTSLPPMEQLFAVEHMRAVRQPHDNDREAPADSSADPPASADQRDSNAVGFPGSEPGGDPNLASGTEDPATPPPTDPADQRAAEHSPIELGHRLQFGDRSPLTIQSADLTRHTAILGGTGSGKTVLACRLIEQALLRGIPALLVDRKGDLASYATEAAWQQPRETPEQQAERDALRQRLDVRLYTPGEPEGRPLALPLIPPELPQLDPTTQQREAQAATATVLGCIPGLGEAARGRFEPVLYQAILALCQLRPQQPPSLELIMQLLENPPAEFENQTKRLDDQRPKLLDRLAALAASPWFQRLQDGETLDLAGCLTPRPANEPTPLTILSTRFLGDHDSLLIWLSLLLGQIRRHAGRHPSRNLQALIMLDEADHYIPAGNKKPVTKEPLMDLFRRSRSAGLGLVLATQNPGDLDYACRDQILTWAIGRVQNKTAIDKLKPVYGEHSGLEKRFPQQDAGEFVLAREGQGTPFHGTLSHVQPEQLSELDLLHAAHTNA